MSIDTFAHVVENKDGSFSLFYGTLSDEKNMTLICKKDTLKEVILEADNLGLEYGLSFEFRKNEG